MRMSAASLLARSAPLLAVVLLAGCGRAHVRNVRAAVDLQTYRNILVESVSVTSVELHAAALADNEQMAAYAREETLAALRHDGRYQVIESTDLVDASTLKLRIDSQVRYGSRALRYFVGFGAGKGRVVSTLTGTVGASNEEKLHSVSESDLAVGAFGGSMKKVIRKNVLALLRNGALLKPGTE